MKRILFTRNFYQTIFVSLLILSFSSCDKSENKKSENNNANFEYELKEYNNLSENSLKCTTGKRTFSTFEAYCVGLKDEALNNYCRADGREQAFIQMKCPGTFPRTAPAKPPVTDNTGTAAPGTNVGTGGGGTNGSGNSGTGANSGSGNNTNTVSPMNARFVLIMPVSSESTDCQVEYERPLKELTTLGDKAAALHPVVEIKTRIYEEIPGMNFDPILEIKFNHGPLITSIGEWKQKIEGNAFTLQTLDYAIRSGKAVKVTLIKTCEKVKNKTLFSEDDVHFISNMSEMKRPGVDVNPNLKFEIQEFKKDQNTCVVLRDFTIDEIKQSMINGGSNPDTVKSADITANYGRRSSAEGQGDILIAFRRKGESDLLSVLKEIKITTLTKYSTDIMKDLKSANTIKLSVNRECIQGNLGQVHFGLIQ